MRYNGSNVAKVIFNGRECHKVIYNGALAWQKSGVVDAPLYSFGVLSDTHIYLGADDTTNSVADLANAVAYYNSRGCKMLCHCGDMTQMGTDAEFAKYVEVRDANKGNMQVYETTGNHEASSGRTYKSDITSADCIAYNIHNKIGKHLCYFIERGKYTYWNISNGNYTTETASNVTIEDASIDIPSSDVFLFIGILGDRNNGIFWDGLMQWVYNVLESHKDKRIFVFEHCRAERAKGYASGSMTEDLYAPFVSGNPTGAYLKPLWGQADNGGDVGLLFRTMETLMAHYTNCIWFHGHTHMVAETELDTSVANRKVANVDKFFGNAYVVNDLSASANNTKWTWSIHIPSCAYPRVAIGNGTAIEEIDGRSQGAIVEVYKDRIVINYIDFAQIESDGSVTYGNEIVQGVTHSLDTTIDEIGIYTPPIVGGRSLIVV